MCDGDKSTKRWSKGIHHMKRRGKEKSGNGFLWKMEGIACLNKNF